MHQNQNYICDYCNTKGEHWFECDCPDIDSRNCASLKIGATVLDCFIVRDKYGFMFIFEALQKEMGPSVPNAFRKASMTWRDSMFRFYLRTDTEKEGCYLIDEAAFLAAKHDHENRLALREVIQEQLPQLEVWAAQGEEDFPLLPTFPEMPCKRKSPEEAIAVSNA